MSRHYSFRISDPQLIAQVDNFMRTGNLSKLINELLWNFFFGSMDLDAFSRELVEIRSMKKKIVEMMSSMEECMKKIDEYEAKFQKLFKEKNQKKEEQLIPKIRKEFDDILKNVNEFLKNAQRFGRNPEDMIMARLQNLARDNRVSLEELRKLLPKAVPEIENLLS